jgi:hypothetical protein
LNLATTTRATPPPFRPRYRDYEVVIREQESESYGGFALTLDDVIDRQSDRFRRELADAMAGDGELPESFDEDFPDRVVYDRGQVIAILRPTADGGFDVVRLDRLAVIRRGGAR